MNQFLNAIILAVLIPASDVQKAEAGPACRAEMTGMQLVTTYEMPGGMVVEGPWRVTDRAAPDAEHSGYTMHAVLDRVVEHDVLTGERSVIPFPEPVLLAFEAETETQLIQRAAQVWCVTVMRARENQGLDHLTPRKVPVIRVAALPTAGTSG